MTLEKILMAWEDGEVTLQQTEDAILSWFKEEVLPREKSYEHDPKYPFPLSESYVYKGYNQCLKDILTNLTAKQGEI